MTFCFGAVHHHPHQCTSRGCARPTLSQSGEHELSVGFRHDLSIQSVEQTPSFFFAVSMVCGGLDCVSLLHWALRHDKQLQLGRAVRRKKTMACRCRPRGFLAVGAAVWTKTGLELGRCRLRALSARKWGSAPSALRDAAGPGPGQHVFIPKACCRTHLEFIIACCRCLLAPEDHSFHQGSIERKCSRETLLPWHRDH